MFVNHLLESWYVHMYISKLRVLVHMFLFSLSTCLFVSQFLILNSGPLGCLLLHTMDLFCMSSLSNWLIHCNNFVSWRYIFTWSLPSVYIILCASHSRLLIVWRWWYPNNFFKMTYFTMICLTSLHCVYFYYNMCSWLTGNGGLLPLHIH